MSLRQRVARVGTSGAVLRIDLATLEVVDWATFPVVEGPIDEDAALQQVGTLLGTTTLEHVGAEAGSFVFLGDGLELDVIAVVTRDGQTAVAAQVDMYGQAFFHAPDEWMGPPLPLRGCPGGGALAGHGYDLTRSGVALPPEDVEPVLNAVEATPLLDALVEARDPHATVLLTGIRASRQDRSFGSWIVVIAPSFAE